MMVTEWLRDILFKLNLPCGLINVVTVTPSEERPSYPVFSFHENDWR